MPTGYGWSPTRAATAEPERRTVSPEQGMPRQQAAARADTLFWAHPLFSWQLF
ncbi:MAG: hypothetical protein PIR02_03510 [Microbacterium enclense]